MLKKNNFIVHLLVLCLAVMLLPVTSFAKTDDGVYEDFLLEENESFELNEGVYNYLYVGKTRNIAMNSLKNNNIICYIFEKDMDKMYYFEKQVDAVDKIETYREIMNDAMKEENLERYKVYLENVSLSTKKGMLRSAESDKVTAYLQNKYGAPFYNVYRASLTENGKTAKLYETKTLSVVNNDGWYDLASLALTAITNITGLPVKVLKILIKTEIKNGIEVAMYGSKIVNFLANVCYQKEVQVGSIYPYRALKDIKGKAYVGTTTSVHYTLTGTYEYGDTYSDNTAIMRKGLAYAS